MGMNQAEATIIADRLILVEGDGQINIPTQGHLRYTVRWAADAATNVVLKDSAGNILADSTDDKYPGGGIFSTGASMTFEISDYSELGGLTITIDPE